MLGDLFQLDLFGLIFGHPKIWLGILVLALAGGLIVFKGAFVKFLTNARVLLVIAVVGGLLMMASMHKDFQALEAKNAALTVEVQSTKDGLAAVSFKSKAQRVNARNTARLHEVIANAPPEQALDSVLDEIAAQQAAQQSGGVRSDPVPQPVGVRDDKPAAAQPGSIDPNDIDRLR